MAKKNYTEESRRDAVRGFYSELFDSCGVGNSAGRYDRFVVAVREILFEVVLMRIQPWNRAKAGCAVRLVMPGWIQSISNGFPTTNSPKAIGSAWMSSSTSVEVHELLRSR